MVTQYSESRGGDVTAQLRDIERQGGGMARFAHICAGLLLVAFSLGSLISISHAAFVAFLASWDTGKLDVPDGISLVVNVLLIVACDMGLLYAASVLRVLTAAGAPKSEQNVHLWAMWGASLLESSTYLYLAWIFDRPSNLFLWALMVTRAAAAPLFAAYLSMARPLPVGPRDIMYHSALASGKGVVRDIATLSADPQAPLHHKTAIFRAASNMTSADRTKLDNLVTVLTPAPVVEMASWTPEPEPQPEPPTPPRGRREPTLRLMAPKESVVRTPRASDAPASYEKMATAAFAAGATSIEKMRAATGMSKTAAAGWVRTLKAEAKGSAVRTRKVRNRDTVTGAVAAV